MPPGPSHCIVLKQRLSISCFIYDMLKIKATDQDHIEVKGVTRSHKGIFCPRTHPMVLKSRDNLPLGN